MVLKVIHSRYPNFDQNDDLLAFVLNDDFELFVSDLKRPHRFKAGDIVVLVRGIVDGALTIESQQPDATPSWMYIPMT